MAMANVPSPGRLDALVTQAPSCAAPKAMERMKSDSIFAGMSARRDLRFEPCLSIWLWVLICDLQCTCRCAGHRTPSGTCTVAAASIWLLSVSTCSGAPSWWSHFRRGTQRAGGAGASTSSPDEGSLAELTRRLKHLTRSALPYRVTSAATFLTRRSLSKAMPPLIIKADARGDDECSMTSNSTMDSDYEIPMALQTLKCWSNERMSARLSQTLGSMAAIRESESMRFSMQTATKWKKIGYHPYRPDASGYTALHRAAKRGDASVISSLLAMYDGRPFDLAAMQSVKQQQIALHVAAKFGNLDGVRLLVAPEFRPLVNQRDRNGNTPLHFAATCSAATAPSIVALLLLRGADPTIKSDRGVFPIVAHVLTAQNDLPEITHLLIKYGSDPNTCDTAGNTILHIAVSQGLWHIAAALVRGNASMTIKNNDGVTVLDMLAPRQLSWLAKFITHPPEWVSEDDHKACMLCERKFSMFVRRHHCRMCGRICCGPCSKYKRRLPFTDLSTKPNSKAASNQIAKVCSTCVSVRVASDDELELAYDQVEALIASHIHTE